MLLENCAVLHNLLKGEGLERVALFVHHHLHNFVRVHESSIFSENLVKVGRFLLHVLLHVRALIDLFLVKQGLSQLRASEKWYGGK